MVEGWGAHTRSAVARRQGWGEVGRAPIRLQEEGWGAHGACGGAGPCLNYLVESLQKSLRLGQRREGGGHHLEGPRRRWGRRCGLRDQMEGWRGRGGFVGPLARRELELEVRWRGGWQSGGCLRGGHNRRGGGRRGVGGWGQWSLRGLGWAWGNGGRGAGRWGNAQLVLDDKDTRQSRGDLGWGARVQGRL